MHVKQRPDGTYEVWEQLREGGRWYMAVVARKPPEELSAAEALAAFAAQCHKTASALHNWAARLMGSGGGYVGGGGSNGG